MTTAENEKNSRVWAVDDPYQNEHIQGPFTKDEALEYARALNDSRKDWNHGNGPNWTAGIIRME